MAVGFKDDVVVSLVSDGPVQTVSSSEASMQSVNTMLIDGCEVFLIIDFKSSIFDAVGVSTDESCME